MGLDPAFTAATARDFLHSFRYTGAKSPHLPEPAIVRLSRAARGIEAALEAVGTKALPLVSRRDNLVMIGYSQYLRLAIESDRLLPEAVIALFGTLQSFRASAGNGRS